MEMLGHLYMQRAFVTGLLLAVIIPCVGMVVVLKRLSMTGDALSHTSLAGVAGGLLMGISPIVGAMVACVLAALGIEVIRKKVPRYAEISIAVVMATGIGLAGLLSGLVDSGANFNSYLFGSILSITPFELRLVAGIGAGVLVLYLLLYKELFWVALDEKGARLAGVPVNLVNVSFTVLTAITVSVAARTVGALMVSSMMVIPVACAMQVAASYRQTLIWSVCFGVLFTTVGLTAAYYLGLRPGATIVLTGVACLLLLFLGHWAKGWLGKRGGSQ